MANSPREPAGEVERLAERLYKVHVKSLAERVAGTTFDTAGMRTFLQSIEEESDRALPILLFAYIDSVLREFFRRNLNPATHEHLLERTAPLSTASARIRMAYGLGWLSNDVYADLQLIRKIRNECAHSSVVADFTSGAVRSFVASMSAREAVFIFPIEAEHRVDPALLTPRLQFHLRGLLVCAQMSAQLLSAPLALKMGLPPDALAATEWEDLPPPMREVRLAVVQLVIRLPIWYGYPGGKFEHEDS